MVGTGKPKGRSALHSSETDQNILKGIVKGVSHVKLTGNIGRGYNDGVGFLFGINLGMEESTIYPKFIKSILYRLGIVCFC